MPHEEVAAAAERNEVLGLEFEVGRYMEGDDVMRLQAAGSRTDRAAIDRAHEALPGGRPARRAFRAWRRLALDSVYERSDGANDRPVLGRMPLELGQ